MKRFAIALLAVTGLFGLSQVASAADLPVKAPAYIPPPAPVSHWTGCYVGLNAGGVWGNMDTDWTPNAAWVPVAQEGLISIGNASMRGSGFTGGGQVGCNWQMNAFVLGAEADIQYTGLDGSRDIFIPASGNNPQVNDHQDFRSRWLATFRGRLGWLFTPAVLVYGTGGLAVAKVDTTDTDATSFGDFTSASDSTTRVGWTVGGGVEWMFAPRWSVKAEYLYVDLGSFSTTGVDVANTAQTINFNHHLTENIARVGVNFHF